MSVLQSGCLESLLLRSLYTDREFWESRGGASGLRPLVRTVEHRGKILLQHIREKKLRLKRDLWMSRLNKAGIITTDLIHHTEQRRDGSMTRCSPRGCACRETLLRYMDFALSEAAHTMTSGAGDQFITEFWSERLFQPPSWGVGGLVCMSDWAPTLSKTQLLATVCKAEHTPCSVNSGATTNGLQVFRIELASGKCSAAAR